jgi:hypothetical protein
MTYDSEELLGSSHPCSIWLELDTAFAAVRLIFVRALDAQILDALDAIESLKSAPNLHDDDNKAEGEDGGESKDPAVDESDEPPQPAPEAVATHIDLFIWLRVMMERFQDEQCHRQAAIRLMFDTASMGALTGGSISDKPGSQSVAESQYDSDNPQVFFPQFSAVVKTLYPHMSLAETAELYASCHKMGDGKVTANVFCELAEMRHLFSKTLKLGPLPLLRHQVAHSEETNEETGVICSSIDPEHATLVRSQVGSLVHQRFALLFPEIDKIAVTLPNKWKALIHDACENVRSSLNEYFVSLKAKKRNSVVTGQAGVITTADGSMMSTGSKRTVSVSGRYIDGMQPFIQYHRLLSIVMVVRSFTENSLLPTSFIVDNSQQMKSSNCDELTIGVSTISVKKVDNVLSAMEHAVFAHGQKVENRNRYERFRLCRQSYFVRKVQNAYRNFIKKDTVVPLALRFNLRPGYLAGGSKIPGGRQPLKSRRVFIEPWAAQLLVANIYALKLSYDAKSRRCGYPQITLANASASLMLAMFSAVDLAERALQDLCLAIQTYMHGSPRLRMFACFMGFGEIDEPFATLFNGDIMLAAFFDLLMAVHKEVSASENRPCSFVHALFPCSEDPATRTDKRDLWLINIAVLAKATTRWTAGISGVKDSTWDNAMTRVKRSKEGLAEVDDYVWVMLQVLAKELSIKLRKCDENAKAHSAKEGQDLLPKKKQSADLQRTSSAIIAEHNSEDKKMMSLLYPHNPNVYVLQGEVEAIRVKTAKGAGADDESSSLEADYQRCCSVFVSNYSSSRSCDYMMYRSMLRDCVLWDTMATSNLDSNDDTAQEGVDVLNCVSRFGDLQGDKNLRHLPVRSGVSPALSLRFYQQWWIMNRDSIANELQYLEV